MRARLIATTISFALVACSQPPPIPDDSGDSQDNASTSKKAPKKSDKPADGSNLSDGDPFGDDSSDPGTPNPKTPTDCSKAASQDACFSCCETKNPKAVKLLNAAYADCACKSPGACATQCAQSACVGKTPQTGDACDTCLGDQQATCGDQAATKCSADTSCSALFQCNSDAGCFEKQ